MDEASDAWRHLGTSRREVAFEALEALGDEALDVVLTWMEAGRATNAHPVDYLDDLSVALSLAARNAPQRFLRALEQDPSRLDSLLFVSALAGLDGDEALAPLLDRLRSRSGLIRACAVSALARRGAPALVEHLPRLLRDRDGSVSFAAARALRTLGSLAHLDALRDFLPRASVGAREAALDAMEAICVRAGAPLPDVHPGLRLERVEIPCDLSGVPVRHELRVSVAERVTAGAPLVDLFGPGAAVLDVPAPCDGVVAAIDHGPPLVITLRRIIAGATS